MKIQRTVNAPSHSQDTVFDTMTVAQEEDGYILMAAPASTLERLMTGGVDTWTGPAPTSWYNDSGALVVATGGFVDGKLGFDNGRHRTRYQMDTYGVAYIGIDASQSFLAESLGLTRVW